MSVWRLRSLVGNMECSGLENRVLPAESSAAAAQSAATDPQFQDSGTDFGYEVDDREKDAADGAELDVEPQSPSTVRGGQEAYTVRPESPDTLVGDDDGHALFAQETDAAERQINVENGSLYERWWIFSHDQFTLFLASTRQAMDEEFFFNRPPDFFFCTLSLQIS